MKQGITKIDDLVIDIKVQLKAKIYPSSDSIWQMVIWHQCSESEEGSIWYEECDNEGENVKFVHGGLCSTEGCDKVLTEGKVKALKIMHLLKQVPKTRT